MTSKLLLYCYSVSSKKFLPMIRVENAFTFISTPLLYSLIFDFSGYCNCIFRFRELQNL